MPRISSGAVTTGAVTINGQPISVTRSDLATAAPVNATVLGQPILVRTGGDGVAVETMARSGVGNSMGLASNDWVNQIARGRAFGVVARQGPATALSGIVELFNPVASGKVLYVKYASTTWNTATNARVEVVAGSVVATVVPSFNLFAGGAAAVGIVHSGTGIRSSSGFLASASSSNNGIIVSGAEWVCALPANTSLVMSGGAVNLRFEVQIGWVETVG